ncbi:hypothetical protein VB712_08670 [Spirulina sp. CCNP1310]|uniref:hypothetical protein n=1 Tax=Spirulina sp. CCNP1310 TaxID=3110249 RepID=UPI002B1F479E|nr:hypothetical protein [Spirulina sp. CCNP1310]MEA5419301.1 hypothetical protein [Spirulina sp. CCNP1310]
MGRKAKRKKQRHEIPEPAADNPAQFVRQFEHRGYRFEEIERSPSLPSRERPPDV